MTDNGVRRERRDRVVWSVTWREIKAATPSFSVELTEIELHDGRRLFLLRAMDGYHEILRALRTHVSAPAELDSVARQYSTFWFIAVLGVLVSRYVVVGFVNGWPARP